LPERLRPGAHAGPALGSGGSAGIRTALTNCSAGGVYSCSRRRTLAPGMRSASPVRWPSLAFCSSRQVFPRSKRARRRSGEAIRSTRPTAGARACSSRGCGHDAHTPDVLEIAVPGRGTVRGAPAASEKRPSVSSARRTPLIRPIVIQRLRLTANWNRGEFKSTQPQASDVCLYSCASPSVDVLSLCCRKLILPPYSRSPNSSASPSP